MTAITISDLTNSKTDVDHIADIATSIELTATDRLGHVKSTLSAAIDSIKSFNNRGAWVTATVYAGKDLVSNSGTWYVCVVAHTSSAAFATDTATKWRVYQGVISGDLAASSGSSIVGYLPAGTGAVATTVQDELRKTVFLSDFGAVGDGTTDDYAAIMLAHDSLPTSGGVVHAGRKQYLFGTPIVFTKPITLIGEGSSIVSGVTGATEFIKKSTVAGIGIALQADGCVLEKFNVRGQVGNTGDGVAIQAGRVHLNDIAVYTMGNDGIRIGATAASVNCNLWRLDNIKSKSNGRHGLFIDDTTEPVAPNVNGGTLTHADLQVNTGAGLCLGNAQLNSFFGLVAQTNGTHGVWCMSGGAVNSFYGGDIEGNPIDVQTDVGGAGNAFFGGNIGGFIADNASSTTFTNCWTNAAGEYGYRGIKLPNADIGNKKVLDWYEEVDISSSVLLRGTNTTTAGAFTVGAVYRIVSVGTTDFTLIGATANTVGLCFTATGVGAGTGTAKGGGTYSNRAASYTRIGNIIYFTIYLTWTNHTGTAGMIVSGLPFQSAGYGLGTSACSLILDNVTYGAGTPVAYISHLNTEVVIYLQASGAALANIPAAGPIDTTGTIVLTGHYATND